LSSCNEYELWKSSVYFWKPVYYFTFGSVFVASLYVQKQLMFLPYFYFSIDKCSHICLAFYFLPGNTTQTTFLCFSFASDALLPYRPNYDGASHTRRRLTGLRWDGEVIGCQRLHGNVNIKDGQLCTCDSRLRVGSIFVEFINGCRTFEYKCQCCFSCQIKPESA
jgi:hypothetical protein